MAIIESKFTRLLLLGHEVDSCSKYRHKLANRGFCKHKMKRVKTLKEEWYEAYDKLESSQEILGNEDRGDKP